MKRFLAALLLITTSAFAGTITGNLQTPNGLPIRGGTLSFTLSQAGILVGTGLVVPATSACYTSVDGHITGLSDPIINTNMAGTSLAGTLPGGTYYVQEALYNATGTTLVSPEAQLNLPSGGQLTVGPAPHYPAGTTGIKIYIGATSGSETLQGQTTGNVNFTQATPLAAGAAVPTSNTTACTLAFNDTIIPYVGYSVALTSASGNAYPGWPQQWQLNGGTAGLVNVSAGAPLWDGTVIYPTPILASPLNHGVQSISGPLNFTGYSIINVGALGIGTSTPSYSVDVQNGAINAQLGYLVNGSGGTAGQALISDGQTFKPGNLPSYPTLHYQCFAYNNSCLPREPAANFSNSFILSDVPGNETNVDLNSPGSGPYVATYITPPGSAHTIAGFDGAGNLYPTSIPTSGFAHNVVATVDFTSCTLVHYGDTDQNCAGTATWSNSISGSYTAVCTINAGFTGGNDSTGISQTSFGLNSQTSTGIGYYIANIHDGAAGNNVFITCAAIQ